MSPEEYIRHRLEDQREWFEAKSAWNQSWYKRLRVAEAILAAAIPFVSSLMDRFPQVPVIVGLMAFLIAIASALLALYRFQEHWLQYRSTAEQLKREKFLFLTNSPPYGGEEAFHTLVLNVETILGQENSTWREQAKSAAAAEPSAGTTVSSSPATPGI